MRQFLNALCWLAAILGLAVVVSALFGGMVPSIAILGHLALYAALAGWALSIAGRLQRVGRAAYVALAVALINAIIVSSAALGAAEPPDGAQTAKMLVFNVRWNNARMDDVVRLVEEHQPEIVILNEVNPKNRQPLRRLDAQFPYRIECWELGACDTLILSRKQLRDPFVTRKLEGVRLGFVRVEVDISGCPVTIFATHLTRPWPYHSLASEAAQFRQVQLLASEVRSWTGPRMVVGDLNATTWSPVVRTLASAVDGRALSGWFGTWPNFLPGAFKLPIDHVIVSQPQITATRRVLDSTGSDHSPVLATVAVECAR